MPRHAADFVRISVDLSDGDFTTEAVASEFFGGRGENNAHLLRLAKQNPATVPDALMFATGPLVGVGYPGASRVNLAGASPLTGGLGSASAGGGFAAGMRSAGVEHLVLHSAATTPLYLVVRAGTATLKDARIIWGETVDVADAWLREQEGADISTAIIGPAGENGVMAAAVIFDGRKAAGRCALGALMGAKQLKAVVVVGEERLHVHDKSRLNDLAAELTERIGRSSQAHVRDFGTIELAPVDFEPISNFQRGRLTQDERKALTCDQFTPFFVEAYGCPDCPVACGRHYRIDDGPLAGMESTGLHANTVTDFGARLGIYDSAAIIAAHGLCNRFGLDIDNTSGVIAWAMEAFQRGALSLEETSGLDLSWGHVDSVLKLIQMIALREGLGSLLADGCCRAAAKLGKGSEKYAITVKGQELEEILRPYKGWALGVVVSERGGTHTRGAPVIELSGKIPAEIVAMAGAGFGALAASDYKGKPEIVVFYEKLHSILDSVGMCYSISAWSDPILPAFDDIAQALEAVVGIRWSGNQLDQLGERIHTLGKLYNARFAAFGRESDYPPSRMQTEQLEGGHVLANADWSAMLDRYYALHGWNLESGCPDSAHLKAIGLSEFAWVIGTSGMETTKELI